MSINVGKMTVENFIIHILHFIIIVKSPMGDSFLKTHSIMGKYLRVPLKTEEDLGLKK